MLNKKQYNFYYHNLSGSFAERSFFHAGCHAKQSGQDQEEPEKRPAFVACFGEGSRSGNRRILFHRISGPNRLTFKKTFKDFIRGLVHITVRIGKGGAIPAEESIVFDIIADRELVCILFCVDIFFYVCRSQPLRLAVIISVRGSRAKI